MSAHTAPGPLSFIKGSPFRLFVSGLFSWPFNSITAFLSVHVINAGDMHCESRMRQSQSTASSSTRSPSAPPSSSSRRFPSATPTPSPDKRRSKRPHQTYEHRPPDARQNKAQLASAGQTSVQVLARKSPPPTHITPSPRAHIITSDASNILDIAPPPRLLTETRIAQP